MGNRNMFRSIFALLLSLFMTMTYYSAADEWDVQARVGGMAPVSSKTREFYRDIWAQYQLEASYNIWCDWSVWAYVAYTTQDGRSSDFHKHSRLQLVPLGLGIKYTAELACCLEGYLGGGVTYSFLCLNGHSDVEKNHVSKGAVGGIAKSGLRYHFHETFFGELFLDYYYTRFNLHGREHHGHSSADLSALLFGAGLGLSF